MKNLDRLIEILSEERGEKAPNFIAEEQKQQYFRALCNIRMPIPVSDEFLSLQDEYLTELNKERKIFDVFQLEYSDDIALWQGDITKLNADAIVNACNDKLLGCFQPLHNCIDNSIHSFAGVQVRLDCNSIMKGGSESNGKVKVTKAYNLPSKYIFHTVGPIVYGNVTAENKNDLKSCYLSCLNKAEEMEISSIAFCCLSTGVFGYPKEEACKTAVDTVKEWKKQKESKLKIIFNVFTDEDKTYYERELYQKII